MPDPGSSAQPTGIAAGKGHIRTQTHDDYRNGTVTLLPRWTCPGQKWWRTAPTHTHRQWLEFLKQIDREIPSAQHIHIILDNYFTHKHPAIKRWLARHPRFRAFYERRFILDESGRTLLPNLSQQAILPGSFGSVRQLVVPGAIPCRHNLKPKRYVWRAKEEEILAKIQRAWKAALGENKNVTII